MRFDLVLCISVALLRATVSGATWSDDEDEASPHP